MWPRGLALGGARLFALLRRPKERWMRSRRSSINLRRSSRLMGAAAVALLRARELRTTLPSNNCGGISSKKREGSRTFEAP